MTEVLSKAKLKALEANHPVVMSKREKLLHWAGLVELAKFPIHLFDGLEDWNDRCLAKPSLMGIHAAYLERTAFGIAAADEKFKEAGLAGPTPAEAMKFFELSQEDLHKFSCNCGGAIHNADMAHRIRGLALD